MNDLLDIFADDTGQGVMHLLKIINSTKSCLNYNIS